MDRRTFLVGLGAALAAPVAAEAQQQRTVYRIAILVADYPAQTWKTSPYHLALQEALGQLGWVEGQNFVFVMRSAEGRYERLPALAADLVKLNADIILVGTTQPALAAKQATATIPIVTVAVGDPVGAGLASSLARPGGNVTGLSQASTDLSGKWLEILKELVPRASRVAVLRNSGNPLHLREYWKETEITARARLLTLVPIDAPDSNKFDRAFAEMSRAHAEGLVVYPRPAFASRPEIQKRFVELARVQRLPTMYYQSSFVEVGGLVSYGVDPRDSYRRVAVYVDKILKGRKPADLPIEQPTKFELAINLKTAKALGLTVPPSLLLRADQIIE